MSTAAQEKGQLRRVLAAALNYGTGSYLPQVLNLLLLPIYAQYLSPGDLGIVDVTLSVQTLVVVLMRVGLPSSLTRFYFDHGEGVELRDLVTTITAAVIAASALTLGLGIGVGWLTWDRLIDEVPFHPYVELALVTAFLQAAPDLQRRLLQAREESGRSAKLSIAFGLATTATTAFFVIGLREGAIGILYAGLITNALFALVAYLNHRADLRGRVRWPLLKEAVAYGLPLVPHQAAGWAQQFASRWVLAGMAAIQTVGHFGMASRLASPLFIGAAAFATAYGPVYFSWRKTLDREAALKQMRRTSSLVLTAGTVGVLGAGTLGFLLIRHVLPAAYHPAAPLVGLVAAAAIAQVSYNLLGMELFYSKATNRIAAIFVLGSLVNVLLLAALLPLLGVAAAALAQLAGSVVALSVTIRLSSRHFPIAIRRPVVATTIFGCAIGAGVPFLADSLGRGAAAGLLVAAFIGATAMVVRVSGVVRAVRG